MTAESFAQRFSVPSGFTSSPCTGAERPAAPDKPRSPAQAPTRAISAARDKHIRCAEGEGACFASASGSQSRPDLVRALDETRKPHAVARRQALHRHRTHRSPSSTRRNPLALRARSGSRAASRARSCFHAKQKRARCRENGYSVRGVHRTVPCAVDWPGAGLAPPHGPRRSARSH
jgi:hypothetical protein